MDKANLALAEFLVAQGIHVHLVAHSVDPILVQHPRVTVHAVARPLGSVVLGEWELDRRGRNVAAAILSENPNARVLVNGGNCLLGDINWVHCVHHAWRTVDQGAPGWFKVKNALSKRIARRRELRAFKRARRIIANSESTARELMKLGLGEEKISTIYLGGESEWNPATPGEKVEARNALSLSAGRPIVAFVGALSFDNNKGFDILWQAWKRLCSMENWDANLVVAGAGSGLKRWNAEAAAAGLTARVHFLGHTPDIYTVLAAADLLVSPVRYEAYGLNIQEAICRGVPVIASACAGIAERYPANLRSTLLGHPEDSGDLISKFLDWRSEMSTWNKRFQPFATALRAYSWHDMAASLVAAVEGTTTPRLERACEAIAS